MFSNNCSTPSQRVKPLNKHDNKGIPRREEEIFISFIISYNQLLIKLFVMIE